MTSIKKHISLAAVIVMLCTLFACLFIPARAFAVDTIDTDKDVTLCVNFNDEGKAIYDAPFKLYYVASVDKNAHFTLAGSFANYPVELNDLDSSGWADAALTLSGYAQQDSITAIDSGLTNKQGNLNFPNNVNSLKPGLYLLVGTPVKNGNITYTPQDGLVCLPSLNEETQKWNYDTTVSPKYDLDESSPYEGKIKLSAIKIWKSDNKQTRPTSVSVNLLRNGKVYKTATLNKSNNWKYTWKNLPIYDSNKNVITWKVTEDVPGGYSVSVSQEDETFYITNKGSNGGGGDDGDTDKRLPQTGTYWWIVPILLCAGLIFLLFGIMIKRKNRSE